MSLKALHGSKNFLPGHTKGLPKPGLTLNTHATSFWRRPHPVTYPVRIVQEKKSISTWTLDSSGKLSRKLIATGLEALDSTYLESHSSGLACLTLYPSSRDKTSGMWYCLPRMAPLSRDSWIAYWSQRSIKSCGHGDLKLNFQLRQGKDSEHGVASGYGSLTKSQQTEDDWLGQIGRT